MQRANVFRSLWRFNAVVIALVSVMALAYGAMLSFVIGRDVLRTRNVTGIAPVTADARPDAPASSREELETQHFSPLPGTGLLWAALATRETVSGSYYGKEATNIRDYVFYDAEARTFRRLLGRNDGLIAQHMLLTAPAAAGQPLQAQPTRGIVTLVVQGDTNGDGRLSAQDLKQVGLADASGRNFKIIAGDIDRLAGQMIMNDGNAVLIVRDGRRRTRALTIGLPGLELLSDVMLEPDAAPAR